MNKKEEKTRQAKPEKTKPKASEETEKTKAGKQEAPEEGFPVVAIGASAGGLHALEGFMRHLPESPGMAFVILQHLDPRRQSIMPSILREYTDLPIVEIEDDIYIEPDRIYVRPPDRQLEIRGQKLILTEVAGHPLRLIDKFFFALADACGENAVCVILSGAGSDGSQGLRAINAAGGLVMVQEEQQAEYEGMPHAAIETGLVDFILPIEEMGRQLVEFRRQSRKTRRELLQVRSEKVVEQGINQILYLVQKATGHDFSRYKKNTLRRRVERRMALHRFESLDDYLNFLRRDGGEAQALFTDLLINVTSFFRDPEAFATLEKELEEMLKEHPADQPVRVWVPGCATGEEAYSIAIVLLELMDRLERQFQVKIFATDINSQSLQIGREGAYPESIAGEMDEYRLRRYFTRSAGLYKISGQLREMVIFSPHNVASDPPFSNLDVVSCRNLLIYMDQQLQKRVLPLLHYSLKQGGLLFLGTSEDVGEFHDLFNVVHRKWKLFRARQASPERHHEVFAILGRTTFAYRPEEKREDFIPGKPLEEEKKQRASVRDLVEKVIVEEYAPPGVLVNGEGRILYFHGDTGRYLTPPQGDAVFNLVRMARSELGGELETLLEHARKRKSRVIRKGARVFLDHRLLLVDLAARRVPGGAGEFYLVTFQEQEAEIFPSGDEESDSRVAALQRELYSTRQDLQATIEELETINEELQSTNEELQANNEELQSTNEEMETSREELQSTNEELETVNSELQRKNEEMARANDDINNLFAASDICTVILDSRLRLQRFTPAATRLFRFMERDLGRPITDISSILLYDELPRDLDGVLKTLERCKREVRSKEGQWFEVRIQPYRTAKNVIAGVVLSLAEITRSKEMEAEARERRILVESILETLREPLLVLEEDLTVLEANRAFYEFFRVRPQITEKVKVYDLGGRQWDLPGLRKLLEEVVPKNTEIRDYRVEANFPDLGPKALLVNARRIDRGEERPKLVLLSFGEARPASAGEPG
jgi:two-component system CheB/CheR fusion protein